MAIPLLTRSQSTPLAPLSQICAFDGYMLITLHLQCNDYVMLEALLDGAVAAVKEPGSCVRECVARVWGAQVSTRFPISMPFS